LIGDQSHELDRELRALEEILADIATDIQAARAV
jgi:hypothetical protein